MNFYRQTIKNLPPVFRVPDEFQNRDVEVIILPLDENGQPVKDDIDRDEMGYPIGFFEETAGTVPDLPDREPQPPYEVRLPID